MFGLSGERGPDDGSLQAPVDFFLLCQVGGTDGRTDSVNVGFHYLSAYREVAAAAAGARGTGREERRRRGPYTKYFPFKAERDRGGEEEIKKEKEERQKGRVGERWRDFEKKRKMSSCRLRHRGGAMDRGRPGAL